MQCSISTFRIRTGLGTQTVTGIVDRNGDAFTPEYIWFINSSSELNIFYSNGSGTYNTSTYNNNFYRVSDGAAGYGATGHLPQFGAKIGSGAGGSGTNSALDSLEADAFFGGNVYRTCRINSVSLGQFEIELMTTTAWAFATDVIVIALANGGDLSMSSPSFLGSTGTHATPGVPKAIVRSLGAGGINARTPGNPATGAGGGPFGWGWDTPNGGPMSSSTHIVNQGANYRYQRTGYWGVDATYTGAGDNGPYVTDWGASSVTVVGGTGSAGDASMVICGDSIIAASGTFTQPAGGGSQIITTGINAALIIVISDGLAALTTVDSAWAEMAVGWYNGTTQATYWGGERRVGNTLPMYGGNYVGDNEALRFVNGTGPNGASTAFSASMQLIDLDPTGTFTTNWTAVDGIERQVLWFALGTAALPPVNPPIAGCTPFLPN